MPDHHFAEVGADERGDRAVLLRRLPRPPVAELGGDHVFERLNARFREVELPAQILHQLDELVREVLHVGTGVRSSHHVRLGGGLLDALREHPELTLRVSRREATISGRRQLEIGHVRFRRSRTFMQSADVVDIHVNERG